MKSDKYKKKLSEIFDGVLQFLKRTSAPATLGIPEAIRFQTISDMPIPLFHGIC